MESGALVPRDGFHYDYPDDVNKNKKRTGERKCPIALELIYARAHKIMEKRGVAVVHFPRGAG